LGTIRREKSRKYLLFFYSSNLISIYHKKENLKKNYK
jgi:hypothetical protein